MKKDIYKNCKALMISEAKKLKSQNNDKPYIRQSLNDLLDSIKRQISWHVMKEHLSEKRANQYGLWLESLTCRLHPKYKKK